uniref:Uncharacterized protein n=1 Tax=Tanacetum cinerariifolium TaxID=118510 RepID=A0A699ISS3_TANCI|nr:hypothetical protein [Tanacetum cinerariifolium]
MRVEESATWDKDICTWEVRVKGESEGERDWERCEGESLNRNSMNTYSGIGVSTKSDDTMNEDTSVSVAFAIQKGVTLSHPTKAEPRGVTY